MADAFRINGVSIAPGQRLTIDLPVTKLYTHTEMGMPVHVIRGKRPGPRLFICAAIHGDELNGVEIIRRLLRSPRLNAIRGTLIAIPIVNVHGLLQHSRYLPDRRDLNRSFPGSERGSLAARLAHLFMTEIVEKCTHGIDLHTGAVHRSNLPHIRANLDDAETTRLAQEFHVPLLLNSNLHDGSLRQLAAERGMPMLLYEGGEGLRFDEVAIRAGERGIISVMRALGMLPALKKRRRQAAPVVARSSYWVRAPVSGIFRPLVKLGGRVKRDGLLGVVTDPFGDREEEVLAAMSGIVLGRSNLPLANEGDGLFHVARVHRPDDVAAQVEEFQEFHQPGISDEPDAGSPIR